MSIVSIIAAAVLTFIIPPMAFYLGIHLGEQPMPGDVYHGLPAALTIMGIAMTLLHVIIAF